MVEFFSIYGVLAAAAGVVAGTVWLLLPPSQRLRLLPIPSLRPTHWRGGEVALAYFIFLLAPVVTLSLLEAIGFYEVLYAAPPSQLRKLLWCMPIALPLTLAMTYGCVYGLSDTRPGNIGMTPSRWRQNVVVGYLTWLVLTPAVLGVYALCHLWGEPEEHPFIDLAKGQLSLLEWGLFVFQATVYAAITEEILFRGLLMGWLRRAAFRDHCMYIGIVAGLTGVITLGPLFGESRSAAKSGTGENTARVKRSRGDHQSSAKPGSGTTTTNARNASRTDTTSSVKPARSLNLSLVLFMAVLFAAYLWWAHRLVGGGQHAPEHHTGWLANCGSAILFAVVHAIWPSQIPLFLFAVALGWLAQRTQSLVGPIVVHGLFNSVACALLITEVG